MSLCRGGKPRIFMNSINRLNIDINVLMRGKEGEENIFSERNISKIDHIDNRHMCPCAGKGGGGGVSRSPADKFNHWTKPPVSFHFLCLPILSMSQS